jgi:vancomycin resistance protein YoaR
MKQFNIHEYQQHDQAQTYRQLQTGSERNTAEIDQDFEKLMHDGYVIIKNLISQESCQAIKQEAYALLERKGRNSFEGLQTQRVYNVLAKTRVTDQLAVHPQILGLMDRLFEPGFLLSQSRKVIVGETIKLLKDQQQYLL